MPLPGRYIEPGYKRSLHEQLWDQRVKMSAAISGKWMPASKEIRAGVRGAMRAGMASAATESAKEPHRALAHRRRMLQAGMARGLPDPESPPRQSPSGEFGRPDTTGEDAPFARYLLDRLTKDEEED